MCSASALATASKSYGQTGPTRVSPLRCFECTEKPGDSWCNGPNEVNLKTCPSVGHVCFTELNNTMLTKGCMLETNCNGTNNKQAWDTVTRKFYGRQCCESDECNRKTTWADDAVDILRRSLGLKTSDQSLAASVQRIMSIQIVYASLYIIVISYITYTYFSQCHNVYGNRQSTQANKVSPPPDQYQTSSTN